jgi:long-chain fatty acid transport protein
MSPKSGSEEDRMSARTNLVTLAVAAALTVPVSALATNGYFAHGWGTKSKAMAGVATALPQDTLVTATNPAGMAFVGTSLDLGVAFFNPSDRGYQANSDFATQQVPAVDPLGNPFQATFPAGPFITPGRYDSDRDWFLVPSFGYNRVLDSRSTIGIALYGNGGMNTWYRDRPVWENFATAPNQLVVDNQPVFVTDPPFTPPDQGGRVVITPDGPIPVTVPPDAPGNGNPNAFLTATTPTGVNLEQLFIEIPYTYKLGDGKQAIGIAPVFAIQSFEARGLQPFRAASFHPDKVTNNGRDWSYGIGVHVGWYGEVTDQLAAGISYRSKMWMTELDEYKGLFADEGAFDIPGMFNLGVAYKVKPNLTIAFDYQHIFYEEVGAVANSNDKDLSPCFTQGPKPQFCLGGQDGLGFGWDSMDVFKLGLRYDHNEKLSFMGGVSYNTDFASGRQALFNILAPATVRWHLTLGATYRHSQSDEFNISFAYMPEEELSGTSASITQTQSGKISMEQKDIEISWTHRF